MSDSEKESSRPEDSGNTSPPKKKFKPDVLPENVSIKVDEKIYRLNRVQLALKSNYFEKLFVEDFAEENRDVVEIKALNSDTFSAIVDLMNGNDLKSVMNADNFVALFMGLDYLQMEIDLKLVKSFVKNFLFKSNSVVQLIQLYNFITANQNYRYLEGKMLRCMSHQLVEITKQDDKFILCLPFEQFVRIIREPNVMWNEFRNNQTVQAKETLSKICSNWICHDVENRIQHFAEIVNAANLGFYTESYFISDEKVKPFFDEIKKDTSRERIQKCFQKLLNYRGEINPDVGQFESKKKSSDEKKNHIVNRIDETKKLSTFLKKGILSDVTIKAGAKTYNLHRYILATATSYFSGPNLTSNENHEFVVDIDEKTFDLIVDFIYFDKIPDSNSETDIMQMLNAAAVLNSKLVVEKCCIPFMKKIKDDLKSEDIIKLLESIVRNNWQSESWVEQIKHFIYNQANNRISRETLRIWQICIDGGLKDISSFFSSRMMSTINKMDYENLLKTFNVICEVNDAGNYCFYIECLCKLIIAPESDPSVESHLVSISCNVLEDLLASEYFVISDPQKIVDICSKWIVHDVKNRYRLIPRIVFAINRNNSMNFDGFESNIPTDLGNCSQKDINDELWKLLNSNCLLSRDPGSEPKNWNLDTRPMFVLPKNVDENTMIPKEVWVVDSELNKIVSLNFLLNHYDVIPKYDRRLDPKISPTLIGDTLFILCEVYCEFRVYAYNFSSKKLKVLASPPRRMYYPMDALLNCNNQLFWCFDDGRVMKYSIELNRWLQIYSSSRFGNHGPYCSDGNKLFRYQRHESEIIQVFDFETSSWTHFANTSSSAKMGPIMRMVGFHNGIALLSSPLFCPFTLLFDSDTRRWEEIVTPAAMDSSQCLPFNAQLAPYGKDVIFADKKGIHHLPRASCSKYECIGGWRLKKRVPSNWNCPLMGIVAIQSMLYTAP